MFFTGYDRSDERRLFVVELDPPQPAPSTATIAPVEIELTANGQTIADDDVTPDSADHTEFGSVDVGQSIRHRFTITNTGGGRLHLTGSPRIEILGEAASDFRVTARPVAGLSADEQTEFEIAFSPSVSGLRSATVRIASSDADEGLFEFAIQGSGVMLAPAEIDVRGVEQSIVAGDNSPSSADHTDFGPVRLGRRATNRFEIANTGEQRLHLTGSPRIEMLGADAGDFRVTARPEPGVTSQQSTAFEVTFRPQNLGLRTATVRIHNDDSDEGVFEFSIQGTGRPQRSSHTDAIAIDTRPMLGPMFPNPADEGIAWTLTSQPVYGPMPDDGVRWYLL